MKSWKLQIHKVKILARSPASEKHIKQKSCNTMQLALETENLYKNQNLTHLFKFHTYIKIIISLDFSFRTSLRITPI